MPHYMKLKNYARHVVDMQHAKQDGTLRVTTEEAGAVVAKYTPDPRIIIYYNLYAETVKVLVYEDEHSLNQLAEYETNQPLTLAAALCGEYQTA